MFRFNFFLTFIYVRVISVLWIDSNRNNNDNNDSSSEDNKNTNSNTDNNTKKK